jgi:tetratricopeptide (TPR) repeat protein
MREPDSKNALIPVQTGALSRQGPVALTKRGLRDLITEEGAERCVRKGKELWEQERWFEAYTNFMQALELNPLCAEAIFYIGCICWRYEEFYEMSGGESGPWANVPLKSEDEENWYLRAAELGFAEAQYELAMVLYGNAFMGNPEALEKAYEWLCKAAKQGHVKAEHRRHEADMDKAGKKFARQMGPVRFFGGEDDPVSKALSDAFQKTARRKVN